MTQFKHNLTNGLAIFKNIVIEVEDLLAHPQ